MKYRLKKGSRCLCVETCTGFGGRCIKGTRYLVLKRNDNAVRIQTMDGIYVGWVHEDFFIDIRNANVWSGGEIKRKEVCV